MVANLKRDPHAPLSRVIESVQDNRSFFREVPPEDAGLWDIEKGMSKVGVPSLREMSRLFGKTVQEFSQTGTNIDLAEIKTGYGLG